MSDKTAKKIPAPIQPVEYPMRPWAKVAVDITGPFQGVPENKKYLLVLVDYYSRWPEVHACNDITSSGIIKWLNSIFARFGFPEELVSDNGTQFTSAEFEIFLSKRGTRHIKTTPYNPAANGMVERLNKTLKESLQALRFDIFSWEEKIQAVLMMLRSTVHRATGETPAQLLFKREIRTKLNSAHFNDEDDKMHEKISKYQNQYERKAESYKVGDYVRVKIFPNQGKGIPQYSQPMKIVKAKGKATFLLENKKSYHARRLINAHQLKDPEIEAEHPIVTCNETEQEAIATNENAQQLLRRSERERRPPDRWGY